MPQIFKIGEIVRDKSLRYYIIIEFVEDKNPLLECYKVKTLLGGSRYRKFSELNKIIVKPEYLKNE